MFRIWVAAPPGQGAYLTYVPLAGPVAQCYPRVLAAIPPDRKQCVHCGARDTPLDHNMGLMASTGNKRHVVHVVFFCKNNPECQTTGHTMGETYVTAVTVLGDGQAPRDLH